MTVVAIHQPNFFPWLGYFDKIARSDVFCIMDNVQMPKTGGTWTNRVMLSIGGKAQWATVPIDRTGSGVQLIRDVRIVDKLQWREKFLNTVRTNYGKAAHFKEVYPLLQELISSPEPLLAAMNEQAIRAICAAIHVRCDHLVSGSGLKAEGHATALLTSMVRAVDGNTYMCGGGSSGYQEDELFAKAGISLVYQHFEHPVYPQRPGEPFLPGLSIIDALMHLGFTDTGALLRSPR